MGDGAVLAILRRQIAEGCDGLSVRIVNEHLLMTAEEIMKVSRLLLA